MATSAVRALMLALWLALTLVLVKYCVQIIAGERSKGRARDRIHAKTSMLIKVMGL